MLNNMSDEFRCFSVSAMDEVCGKGVARGRPFGGLGIFVRKSVSFFGYEIYRISVFSVLLNLIELLP